MRYLKVPFQYQRIALTSRASNIFCINIFSVHDFGVNDLFVTQEFTSKVADWILFELSTNAEQHGLCTRRYIFKRTRTNSYS